MKILLSKTACDLLETHSAAAAAQLAVALLERRVQGWGGLILIDRWGHYGFDHNTSKMAFAYANSDGEIIAGIRK